MSDELTRILCVDDEPNVLAGLERTLFEHFDVTTAESGAEGLEILADEEEAFAVVVSDMRMPQMDGATFLGRVRETAPDTVRVLLTGHSDLDAAIAAVNHGNIFRFLSKPCPQEALLAALRSATEQYRLVKAERELLENTLGGSVTVLTEVLSLAAPVAFARASTVKSYVEHMAEQLGLADSWIYVLSAMLSQLGCVALPPDTLDKMYAGQELSESEQRMLQGHPATAHRLLGAIPRLGPVAEIILQQDGPDPETEDPIVQIGARMLHLALTLDRMVAEGMKVAGAVLRLRKQDESFDPELLAAMLKYRGKERSPTVRMVGVEELRVFMVLDEDIQTSGGNIVIGKGRVVNAALIERLRNFARGAGLVQPFRVRVPAK